ncbi:MAG: transcriptional regulator [Gammaproteobacteria bacterium]|nr:transcriptional regulator [Gammaproteobacteria bacterium]
MTHEQIKKALQERGLSFAAIAKATGRTYMSLTIVSQRKAKGRPSALIIAGALSMPVSDVFPDVPQYAMPARESNVNRAKQILKDAGLSEYVA